MCTHTPRHARASPPRTGAGRCLSIVLPTLLLALVLAACSGGSSSDGGTTVTAGDNGSTVAASQPMEPDETCPAGGYQIDYGIDANGNGALDADEVAGTAILCHGTSGDAGSDATTVLYTFTPVAGPVASCAYGGTRIDMGFDDGRNGATAGDGILQTGEIRETHWLCANGSGVSEGTKSLPVALTLGATRRARVAAGSTSYYKFTAPLAWAYEIALGRTESDLKWTLYSDAGFTTQLKTCSGATPVLEEDVRCTTPRLTKTQTVYLAVTEQNDLGNLFDLTIGGEAWMLLADRAELPAFRRLEPFTAAAATVAANNLGAFDTLAFDPGTATLYGMLDNATGCDDCFRVVNTKTWSATTLALKDSEGGSFTYPFIAMAVQPGTHTLFAITMDEGGTGLYTVNPSTGAVAYVGAVLDGETTVYLEALVFDGAGTLYGWFYNRGGGLLLVNTSNGQGWSLGNLVEMYGTGGGEGMDVLAMAVRPRDGRLVGTTLQGDLVELDPCRLTSNWLGYLPDGVSGPLATLSLSDPKRPPACIEWAEPVDGYVALYWQAYAGADRYNLYWSDRPGIKPSDPTTYRQRLEDVGEFESPVELSYTHGPVMMGLPYYFVVTAVTEVGEIASNEWRFEATMPAGPAEVP